MMHTTATFATAFRVLQQLRRDPRTVVLLIVVPVALVTLVKLIFSEQPATFQRAGVPLVGIFPMTSMFLVTSITMLRERSSGTLERLMTMPVAKLDILAGYAIAFSVLACVQAGATAAIAIGLLDLNVQGGFLAVVGLAVLNAILGMALGLFVSAFAATEFQAVQFMPAFLLPQILLCGLLVPRERMQPVLEAVSNVLPMSYAYDALARVASGNLGGRLATDSGVLVGFAVGALVLGAISLRRRTA